MFANGRVHAQLVLVRNRAPVRRSAPWRACCTNALIIIFLKLWDLNGKVNMGIELQDA